MVDARVYKFGIETLEESGARLSLTRQAIEILSQFATTSDASIQAYKVGVEILRLTPKPLDLTRQSIEVIGQSTGSTAASNVYKFGIEVLKKTERKLDLTRQTIEIVGTSTGNTAAAKTVKLGIEILYRGSPTLTAPASLPSYWEVFAHNWADDILIQTAYDTDISQASSTLTEDRRGLRDRPYRTISLRWTGVSRESIDRLVIFLRKITNSQFFLPLYPDIQVITQFSAGGTGKRTLYCDPSYARFFANQRIAIIRPGIDVLETDVDIYEISSIESDRLITKTDLLQNYEADVHYILPCIDVELVLDPVIEWYTTTKANISMQVDEITAKTALPPLWTGLPEDSDVYGEYPIFNWNPDWNSNPKMLPVRAGEKTNRGRGVEVETQGTRYHMEHQYRIAETKEEFFRLLKFFDSRRGRKLAFWHIDIEDIWEASNIDNVFVEIFPYGDFTEFTEDFDYVGIVMNDGTTYVRKVITIQEILGVYRITVDQALPTLDLTQIQRISRARLSRFMKDVFEERWQTNQFATTTMYIMEILNEQDVEMT